MEEQGETGEQLAEIRRLVRQIWIMMIIAIALVVVPMVLFGCSVLGVILFEFVPH